MASTDTTRQIISSAWQVLEQPPPPTLREILNAYKSKGDGDREMLLAMLNAKSSEDQRMAAMATLHHKLLDLPPSSPTSSSTPHHHHHHVSHHPNSSLQYPPSQATSPRHRSRTTSPSTSPQNITLPPIHLVGQHTSHPHPHKRLRSSHSPHSHSYKRRHSPDSSSSMAPNLNEQLPPSPPFSSPGRSTASSELTTTHIHPRGDAMAIGSLLSSEEERDSEWPSRTSAERDRERDPATYHKPSKVSG